jgi:hypothetical protein
MNNAATLSVEAGSSLAKRRDSDFRNAFLVALAGLFLGLIGSIWLYFQGQNPLLSLATLGSAAILGVFAVEAGMRRSRRAWLENEKKRETECYKGVSALQLQLAESRSAEEMLWRERTQAKESAARAETLNVQLREELDRLQKAEKTFWQRRQELESSKTVLELHVQERTGELQK